MNLLGYSNGGCGLFVEDPLAADQRHFRYLNWLVEEDEPGQMMGRTRRPDCQPPLGRRDWQRRPAISGASSENVDA